MNESPFQRPTQTPFAQPCNDHADIPGPRSGESPAYGGYGAAAYFMLVDQVALIRSTEERQEKAQSLFPGDGAAYQTFMGLVQINMDRRSQDGTDKKQQWTEDMVLKLEAEKEGRRIFAEREKAALVGGGDALADAFAEGLLDTDGLDGITLPDPLVENFLDLNSTARIYGPSRSLKSFVMLDMAACVAAGIPWHGNATTKMDVLYVVAEGVSGIPARVRAWEKAHGRKMQGVRFHTKAVQLVDPEEMKPLIAHAKKEGYGLIIFDTQARSTVGLDENSNTEMGRMVAAVDALRQETGACVMLVHHSGSNATGRARGATAIMGAMDAEFEVERKDKAMSVKLITRKRKDGPESDDLHLRVTQYDVVTVRGEDTSLAVSSATTRPVEGTDGEDEADVVTERSLTPNQTIVLEAAARYSDAPEGTRTLTGDTGLPRNRVSEALSDLVKNGCVRRVGSVQTPKYEVTEIGWVVLNRLELTVGYHQVAPLDAVGDSDA